MVRSLRTRRTPSRRTAARRRRPPPKRTAAPPDRAGRRLAEAVKVYARAVEHAARDGRRPPGPLPKGSGVTQTDVMVAVDALLRAAELEVFEVQIWRSLGRGA